LNIKIDVKGIDTIQKALKDLEHSVDPNTFNEWADRIARTAKQLCNDPNCERIKIVKAGQGRVTFEFADKDAIDCGIKSIKNHLNSMPNIQQQIFKRLTTEFETKKSDFKASA
jgi:hypothetical protein